MTEVPDDLEARSRGALDAVLRMQAEARDEAMGRLAELIDALGDHVEDLIGDARGALERKVEDVADNVDDCNDTLDGRLDDLSDKVDDLERRLSELVSDPWRPPDVEALGAAVAWSDDPIEPTALARVLTSARDALAESGYHRAAEHVSAYGLRPLERLVVALLDMTDADLESRITSNESAAIGALELLRLAKGEYDGRAAERLLAGSEAVASPPMVPDRCVGYRSVLEALPRMVWRAARWLLLEADFELIFPEVERDRLDERLHRPVRAIETPRAGKNDVIAEVVFPGLRRGDRIVRAQVVHYYPTGASAPRYG